MHKRKRLVMMALLATVFSIGHHVDHIIRGNHVGWPLIPEFTPFSYSLGFYPLIVLGFYLYLRGRTLPLFWAILTGAGFFFVSLAHFGPLAVEPPVDILGLYSSLLTGYAALSWLVIFLLLLAGTSLYAGRLWRQQGSHATE